MDYITSDDAETYGFSDSVTDAHIRQASSLVDTYLRRPEGMVWRPDYAGAPGWMDRATPRLTFVATAAIEPGQNVVIQVTPSMASADTAGEVLVLDRAGTHPEACVIVAAQPGTLTLSTVANHHAAGAKLESGLCILEERTMPSQRSMTRLSRPNFARLIAGQGRYGYGRRLDQQAGTYNDVNLLATLSTFGGPPQWVSWNVAQASVSPTTGEIWVPAGILLAYYTDVRIRYVAGFAPDALPDTIKLATAKIATNLATMPPELAGGLVRRLRAGDTEMDLGRAYGGSSRGAGVGNTLLDGDSKAMLDPYRIRAVY